MTDLLLVGGTGLLGRAIAERLAGRAVPFRALVRPRTDASHLRSLGAEVVAGDLTDADSLPPALTGVRTVVTTANAIGRLLAGARDLSIEAVDRHGNESLITAAEAAGVERFVFVAGSHQSPAMVARSPFAEAKVHAEHVLQASPMPSVIVRPAPFQEIWLSPSTGMDPARGLAVIHGRGRTPVPYVAVDDVAEACVRLVRADDPPAGFDFGGPQRLTRHEVVDAFERAAGRRFRRLSVPRPAMEVVIRLLRRRRPALASVTGLALGMDLEELPLDEWPLRELGIEPRPATDAIEAMARAASGNG